MNKTIIKNALINAGITFAYIALIATFLSNIEKIFKNAPSEDTVFAPIMMLLLFVISASVTGLAVLGRPIAWYLDGKRKEAVTLLISTIVCLIIFAVIVFLVIL